MKKRLFFALCAMVACTAFVAQTFEGEITYTIAYASKNPKMSSQQMNYFFGDWMSYTIKGDNYKSTTNGKLTVWQLYHPHENRLYTKTSNTETIFWEDAAVNSDEVLKTELNYNAGEVLGYKCDEVVLTCKSGVQRYFFSRQLAAKAELFKNHKYGNWYDFLKLSSALPLKTVIENNEFVMTSVATGVKEKKIDDSYFKLPSNASTAPAPH